MCLVVRFYIFFSHATLVERNRYIIIYLISYHTIYFKLKPYKESANPLFFTHNWPSIRHYRF
jgi:hypothetical protein